jgi:hypothetical protein
LRGFNPRVTAAGLCSEPHGEPSSALYRSRWTECFLNGKEVGPGKAFSSAVKGWIGWEFHWVFLSIIVKLRYIIDRIIQIKNVLFGGTRWIEKWCEQAYSFCSLLS